jgi:hypothetical protein
MPYVFMFLLGPHTSSRTHVAKHAFLPVPVVFVITMCPDAGGKIEMNEMGRACGAYGEG